MVNSSWVLALVRTAHLYLGAHPLWESSVIYSGWVSLCCESFLFVFSYGHRVTNLWCFSLPMYYSHGGGACLNIVFFSFPPFCLCCPRPSMFAMEMVSLFFTLKESGILRAEKRTVRHRNGYLVSVDVQSDSFHPCGVLVQNSFLDSAGG